MSRKHKTLSDDTWYPRIPIICKCDKCNEVCWNGSEYKRGHQPIERRNLLSDGTFYPTIPSLCFCGCNEVVYNGAQYIDGHQGRANKPSLSKRMKGNACLFEGHYHTEKTKDKIGIANTKLFLLKPDGSKEIYPPIFDLCWCGCNEIVWNGTRYKKGHLAKIDNPNKGNFWTDEQKILYGGKNHHSYIDGRSRLPYCFEFDDIFKEQIRVRDNYTCQNCGRIQQEELLDLDQSLSVHHIHYDKENPNADLICLCNRCNSKANKNHDYWESLFMNKLNYRELLFWSRRRNEK